MLTDSQIIEVIKEKKRMDPLNVQSIRRVEIKSEPKATVQRIIVELNHLTEIALIEKCTFSKDFPYENQVFRTFSPSSLVTPAIYINDYNVETQQGVLLMDDLSKTHAKLDDWEVPLSNTEIERILKTLATFHNLNWENKLTRETLGLPWHLSNAEHYRQHLDYLERDLQIFLSKSPFHLEERKRQHYESSLRYLRDNYHHVIERVVNNRALTFIHGDLHGGNILFPATGLSSVLFFDLEAVKLGLCTDDLVRFFVHEFYHGGDQTNQLLQIYFDLLNTSLHSEYSKEQFMCDFKYSLMEGMFFPLKLFAHYNVQDEELLLKSLDAFEFFCNR